MASKTKTRGFDVGCILCGDKENMNVSLHSTSVFTCGACGESFTAADVRESLAAWTAVLEWIDAAPEL
jgi:transcription elongation factor Elf1